MFRVVGVLTLFRLMGVLTLFWLVDVLTLLKTQQQTHHWDRVCCSRVTDLGVGVCWKAAWVL